MYFHDRLTETPEAELIELAKRPAEQLTFNQLLALAGAHIAERKDAVNGARRDQPADAARPMHAQNDRLGDANRDLAIAHAALEDALTRYNSACYRIAGTWKRADPDRASS